MTFVLAVISLAAALWVIAEARRYAGARQVRGGRDTESSNRARAVTIGLVGAFILLAVFALVISVSQLAGRVLFLLVLIVAALRMRSRM